MISEGARFCASHDEYISIKCVRYMNFNVHHKDMYRSLGLFKILGSLNSAKTVETVKKRFADSVLDLDKLIVGSTTDGVSHCKV